MDRKTKKRFEEKIDKNASNGCWNWVASKVTAGYGQFRYRKTMKLAHRISWESYRGKIPKSKHVLHTCDNRKCVNPSHLYIGTPQDNTNDMMRRGRWRKGGALKGEKHHNSKLNQAKANKIRHIYKTCDVTQKELADEFGVTQSQISDIIKHKRWNET